MKKERHINLSFKKFLEELKTTSWRYSLMLTIILFLFTLPGQNYYQTIGINKKEPAYLEVPFVIPAAAPAPYPLLKQNAFFPEITAQSAVLVDLDSGVTVYENNPKTKLLPASTTKIMTAIVALNNYQENGVLTAWESISESSTDASLMGLQNGDRLTTKALLYGLLLNSGADAAETLSQNFPGGKEAFIEEMNKTAANLHLTDTHFANETGLDDANQYTTVFDLARLTREALKKPLFAQIVATREFNAFDISGKKRYYLKNINKLLNELEGTRGIKTGYTQRAGECLVAMVERSGHKLISVVLNSQDRFTDTKMLVNWAFEQIDFIDPLSLGKGS